ncbi:MAG: outer membrane beta-barrel protein [Flavobacteriaceae bacterium]|nr:outer membrane beta-barrel protein [Flavobacteriaceae bacterium]
MRENKNIDRLFQEKLKDFEVSPPIKSWNFIEKNLVVKPPKRSMPLWIRITGIAAMLLAFISLGNNYIAPKNLSSIQEFIFKHKDTIENIVKNEENPTKKVITDHENTLFNVDVKVTPLNPHFHLSEINLDTFSEILTETPQTNKPTFFLKDAHSIPLGTETSKPEIPKEKRWSIAYTIAPIYFSSFGSGDSPVDAQFENNSTSGKSNFSHGIKIAFKLNNKFSVQSGVNVVDIGYTTNNIHLTPGVAIISLSDISNKPIESLKTTKMSLGKEFNTSQNNITNTTGSIDQVFGYIEIPLEIKYQITDGKLGLNIVGGFSTLFLNKNELVIEADGFRTSIGEASNLKEINFSGNIGVDVDYLIHKNLYINISPMLKVQTNTFSKSTGDYQPYYLGIYTGLNFKF